MTEPLMRMAERPAVTRLIADGPALTIDRDDFPRSSPRPGLTLMDLTANFVLLTTLFAVSQRTLGDRNIVAFLAACALLVLVHMLAVIANVESIYALRLGPWSTRNYGPVARNFWGAAAHFYSLVGIFGAAFSLWWLFRPAQSGPSKVSPRTRRRR